MSALRISVPGRQPSLVPLDPASPGESSAFRGSLVVGSSGEYEDEDKKKARMRRNNAMRPTTRAGRMALARSRAA